MISESLNCIPDIPRTPYIRRLLQYYDWNNIKYSHIDTLGAAVGLVIHIGIFDIAH
jgi:hypothetical protein